MTPTFPTPMGPLTSASTDLSAPPAPAAPAPPPPTTPAESWTSFSHATRKTDGSVTTELYDAPRFRNSSGTWTPVDPTVKPTAASAQPASADGALRPIRFGNQASDIVELGLDGGPVTLSSPGLKIATPTQDGAGVTYANAATDTDLRYVVGPGGLKEELVLRSGAAPRSFTFHLSDPKNQLGAATATPDGGYRFAGRIQGDVAVDLPAPVAYEANAAATGTPPADTTSAHLTAKRAGDGYDLTVSVGTAWAAAHPYPQVLDPTVAFNEANNTITNGWASSSSALNTTTDHLPVGTFNALNYNPARAFVKFDVSSIPTNSTVNAATYTAYIPDCVGVPVPAPAPPPPTYKCASNDYTVELRAMTAAWGSGTAWTSLSAATSSSVMASDHLGSFAQPFENNPNPEQFTLPKTQVQSWVNGASTNYGFTMKLATETPDIGGPSYYSSRGGYVFHPTLVVNYTPPLAAPQSVSASPASGTAVLVTWAPPPDTGAAAPTTYTVTSNPDSQTATCIAPCGAATVSGLTPNLAHTFSVVGSSSSGSTPGGLSNSVTPSIVSSPTPVSVALTATDERSAVAGLPAGIVGRGDVVAYSITFTNLTPLPLGAQTFTQALPAGMVGVPDLSGCAGCTFAGTTISIPTNLGVLGTLSVTYKSLAQGVDRGCSLATSTTTASGAQFTLPLAVCGTGLGLEDWWSYAAEPLGPQSQAKVNVANGNVVVQATDTTPVQARGRFDYVLRRTYNSQDPTVGSLPSAIGAGWQLNIGQADGLVGDGVGATALSVPSLQSATNPTAVTLVDRDGTRHLFTPKGASASLLGHVSGGSLIPNLTGAAATAFPNVLNAAFDTSRYNLLCADQTYQAPAGVHLSLWRYLAVSSASCTDLAGGAYPPVLLGFAAERPDRIRYEFDLAGHLLDMVDGSGNDLRYAYVGNALASVYETRSSCPGGPSFGVGASTCRALVFNYTDTPIVDGRPVCPSEGGMNVVCVTDPAGRLLRYVRDSSNRLVTVTTTAAGVSDTVRYTYGSCGGWTNSLCSVTDPRAHATTFTYGSAPVGLPRLGSMTDRRAAPFAGVINATYARPDYVSFDTPRFSPTRYSQDTPSERRRFSAIDPATGRVGEIDEGDTADNYLHQATYTWDVGGAACRQPDGAVDNNLCRVVRRSLGSFAPDEDTRFTYNAEGRQLVKDQTAAPMHVINTWGFHAHYVEGDGTAPLPYDDAVAGNGTVSSGSGTRGNAATLFAISDQTQALTARGNLAGATVADYLTASKPDNNPTVNPNAAPAGPTCVTPSSPANNTGNPCETDAPVFNRTNPDPAGTTTHFCDRDASSTDGTHPTVTCYTYDAYGQRATMTTPKAVAETPTGQARASYAYTYYDNGDLDQSDCVSAAGWLKAVTDPNSAFVAFGYDRAGNVTRTWDRNATAASSVSAYPGTRPLLPSCGDAGPAAPNARYHEVISNTVSSPWRFVSSDRDPAANLTTYTLDANGNQLAIRPPRGNAAGNASYDVVQTFNNNDKPISRTMPAEAGHPATSDYDPAGNRTSATDPKGNVTAYVYDALNRPLTTRWTTTTASPACHTTTTADAPLPLGHKTCVAGRSYDGTDNVIGTQDGNAQISYASFDGAHRAIQHGVARNDGVYTSLVTTTNYDADGHAIDVCPPRELDTAHDPGASGSCSSTGPMSTHNAYDPAGRLVTRSTYRIPGAPNASTMTYDADGNQIGAQDQNHQGSAVRTVTRYDLLDRKAAQDVPRTPTTSNTTTWAYDPVGDLTAVTKPGSPAARVTAYGYDADNRLTDTVAGSDNVVAAAAGAVDTAGSKNIHSRVAYDADGHLVARYDPRAFDPAESAGTATFVVRTDYDADGRPVAQYVPRYDGAAHADTFLTDLQTATNTQTTQCPTNPSPAPQTVAGVAPYASSVGVCVTRVASFDYAGNPTSVTEATATGSGSANRHVDLAYTDDNRLVSANTPNPASSGGRVNAATYAYDGEGQAVLVTDANGDAKATSYTSDKLVASEAGQAWGALTHLTTYGYDANANRTSVTDPAGNTTTTGYFDDNRRQQVSAPDGATNDTTVYDYDATGNVIGVHAPTAVARDANNPGAKATTNTYTDDNLLANVYAPVTTAAGPDRILTQRHTAYGYDPGGRKLTQAAELIDANGTRVGGIDAQGLAQSFAWFQNDRLGTETGRDGATTGTNYDAAGNKICVFVAATCAADPAAVVPSYYADGLVRLVGDGRDTVRYAYDGAGNRAVRKDSTQSGAYVTSYNYGAGAAGDAGLPASMASQAAGWTGGSPSATTFTYDAGGRKTLQVNPNALRDTFSFNPDDTLASRVTTNNSNPPTAANTVASWSYAYDADYRQLQQTFTGITAIPSVVAADSFYYHYNAAGRLDSVGRDGLSTLYASWDHDGNRTAYNDPSGTTVYNTYNADDSVAARQDAALHYPTYYAWGGLETDGAVALDHGYVYDGSDRTKCVGATAMPATCAGATSYAYDGLDRQRSHTEGAATTALHYDGLASTVSVEEKTATPKDTAVALDPANMPVGSTDFSAGTTPQYLGDDGHANVTTVTGPASINCTARFDPFGTAVAATGAGLGPGVTCNTGATSNDFFYRGGRRDGAAGDYQFGARTYDPKKASFTTPDSYRTAEPQKDLSVGTDPLTQNRYSYVNGDPVNLVDPDGHWPNCYWGCRRSASPEPPENCVTRPEGFIGPIGNECPYAVSGPRSADGDRRGREKGGWCPPVGPNGTRMCFRDNWELAAVTAGESDAQMSFPGDEELRVVVVDYSFNFGVVTVEANGQASKQGLLPTGTATFEFLPDFGQRYWNVNIHWDAAPFYELSKESGIYVTGKFSAFAFLNTRQFVGT